ncbi:MAG: F0F1 ATP synthase subunit B [Bacteroidetes bacterium]|nr:F0F1 ATP synthase subunit B [Bacteroidota bacterium]
MILIELPPLVNPELGLIFWMTLSFVLVLVILRKYAWKPIMASLQDREETIEKSLQEAENARSEMARLTSQNEQLLAEARVEREKILNEARQMKEKIVGEAKSAADDEAKKLIARANDEINKQKLAAIDELKKEVAGYSIAIAEKLVQKQLDNKGAQQELIATQLKELTKTQSVAG